VQFDRLKARESPDFVPARLFIYFNEREIEHTVALDNGAQLRDGIKSVAKFGVCPEDNWPYNPVPADPNTHLFPVNAPEIKKPDPNVYKTAISYKAISYSRVNQSLSQLKGCLAAGYPFVFGFTVYSSFYGADGNPKTVISLPGGSDTPKGGHAVMAVGYDDEKSLFVIRNSWGVQVQEKGYFYMPYAYLTDSTLSGDFWTIRAVAD
jgi:C1A family cysteine protease